MYKNNKILVGKNDNNEANLLLDKANRHGLITGASGSGKTITLKVLAEGFSASGVPVILSDVKGDLAGTSLIGNLDLIKDRVDKLCINDFNIQKFPVTFFDVYGVSGHPIRTTVKSIGSRLLSHMLNLTDTQESVLSVVFKICEDENLNLIDLNDLRSVLNYIGENRKNYTLKYGNISLQSIGAIQRNVLNLEEEGGNKFFGLPQFEIKDFIHFDGDNGFGQISILHSVKLFQQPILYSSVLLWMLISLYNELPEVGDLEKPKLVMFFDEAHLLFSDMPSYLLKQIIQIVKLIRSKGVGLYFISQTPSDIPDDILGQLGNRIQHVLRSYTKTDEKVIKAAADSFRINPKFNSIDEIKTLATGEALISLVDEFGQPTVVDKFKILPPQSKMGVIDDELRKQLIQEDWLYNKYEKKFNYESSEQKIAKKNEEKNKGNNVLEKKETKKAFKKTKVEKYTDKLANKTINTIGRNLGNQIFKGLFK